MPDFQCLGHGFNNDTLLTRQCWNSGLRFWKAKPLPWCQLLGASRLQETWRGKCPWAHAQLLLSADVPAQDRKSWWYHHQSKADSQASHQRAQNPPHEWRQEPSGSALHSCGHHPDWMENWVQRLWAHGENLQWDETRLMPLKMGLGI